MADNLLRFRFEIECESSKGEELFIVGSDEQLGRWSVSQAKPMICNPDQRWTFDTCLPHFFEYKYFLKNEQGIIRWERENRVLNFTNGQTPPIMEVCCKDAWDTTSSEVYVSRRRWWKEAVVYQIYPKSFCDSNGDGIGDIRGIIQKLDYLKELGIDVVWLSPVYKSPGFDGGYDISNYCEINEEFGTMNDFDEMVREMDKRNIKVIMDLVVNHTSDQHKWFQKSKKSKTNSYRDYYVWRPPNPTTGKEPNNWSSFFGGSAWQYDPETEEYYLHLFTPQQPDLNWENPSVRKEIFEMMDFWLEKGVHGFRMDVINIISKVSSYPDATAEEKNVTYQWGGEYFVNGPRLFEFLQEMKEKVLSRYETMTVGETPFFGTSEAVHLTNERNGVVNMLFHFELMDVDTVEKKQKWEVKQWQLKDIKSVMTKWQLELQGKGWNSLYLENHDQPRSVSRFGNDKEYRVESAKMLATWLHMMQGTPYIYQGQEIGMTNVQFDSIEDYKDVETLNMYTEYLTKGVDIHKIMRSIYMKGRDNARTPMQWNSSPHGGFTVGTPWLKENPNYVDINVEKELRDPNSIFNYYKKLIQIRKDYPVIVYGTYTPLEEDHETVYSFIRELAEGPKLLVIANFFANISSFQLPRDVQFEPKQLVISNYEEEEKGDSMTSFTLRPYEVRVYYTCN